MRKNFQEIFRIFLHQHLFHLVVQIVLMIVQRLAAAVNRQGVIAVILRLRTSAGTGKDRFEGLGQHPGRILTGADLTDQFHGLLRQGFRIVAAGCQVRLHHVGGG